MEYSRLPDRDPPPEGTTSTSEPRKIGRYVVSEVIGRGAMGIVYRGHDPLIDRDVAVKTIRTDLLADDMRDEVLSRFCREAQAAGRFVHPNIVAVFDFDGAHEPPFIAMELIDGKSLAELRKAGLTFDLPRVRSIMVQLLSALECAHGHDVVHRDIKPSNVLLEQNNRVKVLDFGVARFIAPNSTQFGKIVGTARYMAPEQFLGQIVDQRTDIFAAGVIMYELITVQRPFPGDSHSEILERIMREEGPDPAELVPNLPPAVRRVVRTALAADPDDRFQNATMFRQALEAAFENVGEPVPASDLETMLNATQMTPPLPDSVTLAGSDPEVLSQVEKDLARAIGPIAGVMLRRALKETRDLEALYKNLARHIEPLAEREKFRQRGDKLLARIREGRKPGTTSRTTRTTSGSSLQRRDFDPVELDAAARALARFCGPIAQVMVRKAAANAGSLADLYQALAENIDNPRDRETFLRDARRLF